MRIFEVEGDSVEEIVAHFMKEKDVPSDYIKYEVMEQGSKGLFGLGKKTAKVKISYNEVEHVKKKGKLLLNELLEKAGFADAHVTAENNDNRVILNIETDTPELLIGKSAQTLDALQYVFDKMINLPEDTSVSLIVDVGYYRKRRVEENVSKALAMAEKVKRSGRPFKLAPMSSIIRKEIHIALKSIPGITTISTGEGPLKQISIVSEKSKGNNRRFNGNKRNFRNKKEDN